MSLPHAILGILAEQPLTGYELKTVWFDRTIAHFWSADHTQIYRTLDKLTEAGLVTVSVEHASDRPMRKVYSLTAAGRAELQTWLSTPQPAAPIRDPLLIQLFCGAVLSNAELASLLERERTAHEQRLANYRNRLSKLELAAVNSRSGALRLLTLRRGMQRVEATIDWLEDALQTVAILPDDPAPGQ